MFVAFYWLIACGYFALGNTVPEPFFEDFQDQAFEESPFFFAPGLTLLKRRVLTFHMQLRKRTELSM
jgi:hypothetical protein